MVTSIYNFSRISDIMMCREEKNGMELSILISICSLLIVLITFIVNRIDKAKKDSKEDNYGLLNYKIDELKDEFVKFSNKFDKYENEIDERIEKAVNMHIKLYHSKDK